MWVFGYGSLIWNPGFDYLDSQIGHIKGYSRRFWQGNDYHRGSKTKMGRVATLVDDAQGLTWGRAFLLDSEAEESTLLYLNSRESTLGGYCTRVVDFHPREESGASVPSLVYLALPSSALYMGASPLHQVADEIAVAKGLCGHNAEYLFRLVDFMRMHLPEVWDEHLFHLDHLVRERLKEKVDTVMGNQCPLVVARLAGGSHKEEKKVTPSSMDFVSTVPSRTLRCLDI